MRRNGLVVSLSCLAALGAPAALADSPQPLPGSKTVLLGDGISVVVPPATIPCADGKRGPVVWGAKFSAAALPKWKLQTAVWGDRNGAQGSFHIEHQFFSHHGSTHYTRWGGPRCGVTYQLSAHLGVRPGGKPLKKKVKKRVFRFSVAPA
jgi:hypothetical protein